MIKLLKLYSKPTIFDPIVFKDGINLILGEKVSAEKSLNKKDRKTNGVGKSMSIEFLNFCLLKNTSDSRVMKIPVPTFPESTKIMLDLLIGTEKITICRTKESPNSVTITKNGEEKKFEDLDLANLYLNDLVFSHGSEERPALHPSFRELIGPLIRDEDSEFKEITACYDLTKRIPPSNLIKTHLYFFKIDFSLTQRLKGLAKKLEDINKFANTIKKDLLLQNNTKKLDDVKLLINSLGDELKKWAKSLEQLKTNDSFEFVQEEIIGIDSEIDQLRFEQSALKYEIKKIKSLPKPEEIDLADLEIVFNQFKDGLGDSIVTSFEEAISFKNKIQEFQDKIMGGKLSDLINKLELVNEKLASLEERKLKNFHLLDNKGLFKDLKNSISIYDRKSVEFTKQRSQLDQYEEFVRQRNSVKAEKEKIFVELEVSIFNANNIIHLFDSTVRSIHEYIMGNTKTLFDIKPIKNSKTEFVDIDLRIDDDGSHSVDRTKVFIYDIALMFNEITKKRHPMFLVHDNIFDVDQDTLVQSLNYLNLIDQKYPKSFQYILTLNRDKIENEEKTQELKMDVDYNVVANFTRQKKFLKTDYQEEI